jgi:hypothetical protein
VEVVGAAEVKDRVRVREEAANRADAVWVPVAIVYARIADTKHLIKEVFPVMNKNALNAALL